MLNMKIKHLALATFVVLNLAACGGTEESPTNTALDAVTGSWVSTLANDCFVAQEFSRDKTYVYQLQCTEVTSSTSARSYAELESGTFSISAGTKEIVMVPSRSSCLDKASYTLSFSRISKTSLVLSGGSQILSFVPAGQGSEGYTFQIITGCYEESGFVARPVQ